MAAGEKIKCNGKRRNYMKGGRRPYFFWGSERRGGKMNLKRGGGII